MIRSVSPELAVEPIVDEKCRISKISYKEEEIVLLYYIILLHLNYIITNYKRSKVNRRLK